MPSVARNLLIVLSMPLSLVLFAGCQSEESDVAQAEKSGPPVESQRADEQVVGSKQILQQRQELDKTVWAPEVEAQEYEAVFVRFWDQIRTANPAARLEVLANFGFSEKLSIASPGEPEILENGIQLTRFDAEPNQQFTPAEWKKLAQSFDDEGIRVVQTEWHHSRFVPATESTPAQSTISFSIHAIRATTQTTLALKGDLEVKWNASSSDPSPDSLEAGSIAVKGLTLQQRSEGGLFTRVLTAQHGPDEFVSAYPIMVYDLDGDGLSEIIIPRWNRVYWNRGKREFEQDEFLEHPVEIWEAGIISDFNSDGHVDFVTVGKDGSPYFFQGNAAGKFPEKPVVCADVHFDLPTAITAGDVDDDGDLDLWMAQYKLSFTEGQMPTPFYDANDGPPSFFLENNGQGMFKDATDRSGLSALRNRRTYSASFVDLDEDHDLDLVNVSDYAGLDIYENQGDGTFNLATESYVKDRHFFGMGHTFGDYNNDGRIDFYVIGMSSTTARRLDRLNLGRDDRPDVHPMRATMGYGNRMYLGTKNKHFQEDRQVAAAVARTGWSWGVTSFDLDLDADLDLYVANGHRSGDSCQDYCTTFWRHDIYTGDSKEDPEVRDVFEFTLSDMNENAISWNGYEKNVLFLNHPDKPNRFFNSSFMFGAAYEFDARSVISDDLDADGWPDLIVAQSNWNGRGFALSIHVLANDIDVESAGNWLAVRLKESAGPGFSPNGAKVAITDDLGTTQTRWIVSGDSFLAQHATVAHFGLGDAKEVAKIEVTWPNGKTQVVEPENAVNRTIQISGNVATN